MPELPGAMRERFTEEYDLSDYDAAVLTQSKDLANYFELICAVAGAEQAKPATNLLIGDFASALNRDGIAITEAPVSPPQLAVLLHRIADGTIRSEEHTSELQSLMRTSYAVFCLNKKNNTNTHRT